MIHGDPRSRSENARPGERGARYSIGARWAMATIAVRGAAGCRQESGRSNSERFMIVGPAIRLPAQPRDLGGFWSERTRPVRR